jgi:hypothetical protein
MAGAPAATVASATATEIRDFRAATECHHQHNTVHRVHLLQKEANPCNIRKPLGLEPKANPGLQCPGVKIFCPGKIVKIDNYSQQEKIERRRYPGNLHIKLRLS